MITTSKIFGVLLLLTLQAQAAVQLGAPKFLGSPPAATQAETPLKAEVPFNTDALLKSIEEVVSREHPEMYARWQKYLRLQNLDPENEDKTILRLQQKYLGSIQSWGDKITDCESSHTGGRWLRRLRKKFGSSEISLHKKEIAKIVTSLYLKRKTECMQAHEEVALRAEREIYAFSFERTRLLIDFISQNSEMQISQPNKLRLLSSLKRKQNSHTLSDRSVDLNSLRLETKLQNLPKIYVDFLAHEQSFKKPFDLHKNLSLLSSEYDETPPPKKNRIVHRSKKPPEISVSKTTS